MSEHHPVSSGCLDPWNDILEFVDSTWHNCDSSGYKYPLWHLINTGTDGRHGIFCASAMHNVASQW